MRDREVEIYALRAIGTEEVRYVGKTVRGLKTRLKQHKNECKKRNLPVHRWIRKNNFQVEIFLLQTVAADDNWQEAEQAWIAAYRTTGRLLNLADGGQGPHGYKVQGEHLRKLREIGLLRRKKVSVACSNCGDHFMAPPARMKRARSLYCSISCKNEHHGKNLVVRNKFSPAALEAAARLKREQTHCVRGHALSGDNLRISSGRRVCRECSKMHGRVQHAKKRGVPVSEISDKKQWSEPEIRDLALRFTARKDFRNAYSGAVQAATRLGILDEVCSHMKTLRTDWTDEMLRAEAAKYETPQQFAAGSPAAYVKAHKTGRFSEICPNIKSERVFWTDEMLRAEAAKYEKPSAFKAGNPKAFGAADKRGLMRTFFPNMRRTKT